MRSMITSTVFLYSDNYNQRAKRAIKDFMVEKGGTGAMVFLVRKFNRGFVYI